MVCRNNIFDAIKALAIWLVVLGHSIQHLSGVDYWNDALFQFIYSFHMPLFFMISGFFFASSIKLGWREFLRKKALTLLLPCLVWGIIEAVAKFETWSQLAADIFLPTHWPFWFFKGLFLVQVFVYAIMRLTVRMGGGAEITSLFVSCVKPISICNAVYGSASCDVAYVLDRICDEDDV